ncbi:MAG: hypothetical protein UX30_C0004G0036 [Candidatus Saccharibacteria bacterium GW2011_GWA2_46_10]|nr:MAG: hypothetical protein UX30_C0004G0036 [Candidatus Saccharibacteria bacterium GW2011_GWA2_46_10]
MHMPNIIELPGLIDCHVHLREPGFPEKGDMESEYRAAMAGGISTVCDMPNTVPPTVSARAFADKVTRAEKIKGADIRFFFGVMQIQHLEELKKIVNNQKLKERLCGVKVFFDHSTGDMGADKEVLEETFKTCGELDLTISAHCEDSEINAEAKKIVMSDPEYNEADISLHSLMRPCASEEKAISDAIALAEKFATRLHIAHISTSRGLNLVREAKRKNVKVTCEVAPHHLFMTVEDYERLGTFAKVNPPLRTSSEQEALWEGIADGTIDCIASDHAPHTITEKNCKNPIDAPSGVPGTETLLPLLLTVASGRWPHPSLHVCRPAPHRSPASAGQLVPGFARLQVSDILRLCFTNPNRIFKLNKSPDPKIKIDLRKEWVIKGKELHYKCGWTPYEGWRVVGKLRMKNEE